MQGASTMTLATFGLILSGAGLAGGFPIMLGFVGEKFSDISGTAFSFVFVVALIGNMLVNFLTGLIVHYHGVGSVVHVSYFGGAIMAILLIFIVRRLTSAKPE